MIAEEPFNQIDPESIDFDVVAAKSSLAEFMDVTIKLMNEWRNAIWGDVESTNSSSDGCDPFIVEPNLEKPNGS